MVASRKIQCTVLKLPAANDRWPFHGQRRPSELVPWADPYIAGLVAKLQAEVRAERDRPGAGQLRIVAHVQADPSEMPADLFDDVEIPWMEEPLEHEPEWDDDWHDHDRSDPGDLTVMR